ncbi:MAG: ribonuclease P protein component [Crocinitomicaceae bacterium]
MVSENENVLINQKLGKNYKLCSEKKIASLFKEGKKMHKFPFTAHYLLSSESQPTPFQVVIGVPKRNFKKAKDRNHIKRKIKEAIRKNKLNLETLLVKNGLHLSFFLLYTNKEDLKYDELFKKTDQFLALLIENIKHEQPTKS